MEQVETKVGVLASRSVGRNEAFTDTSEHPVDVLDVLAVMANPVGWRNAGRWGTGEVAQWMRLRGSKVATSRVLTALRREQRAGNVECLGPLSNCPGWHGHNITANAELQWRLSDDYAIAHGNEACRAALARVGGGK